MTDGYPFSWNSHRTGALRSLKKFFRFFCQFFYYILNVVCIYSLQGYATIQVKIMLRGGSCINAHKIH